MTNSNNNTSEQNQTIPEDIKKITHVFYRKNRTSEEHIFSYGTYEDPKIDKNDTFPVQSIEEFISLTENKQFTATMQIMYNYALMYEGNIADDLNSIGERGPVKSLTNKARAYLKEKNNGTDIMEGFVLAKEPNSDTLVVSSKTELSIHQIKNCTTMLHCLTNIAFTYGVIGDDEMVTSYVRLENEDIDTFRKAASNIDICDFCHKEKEILKDFKFAPPASCSDEQIAEFIDIEMCMCKECASVLTKGNKEERRSLIVESLYKNAEREFIITFSEYHDRPITTDELNNYRKSIRKDRQIEALLEEVGANK